MAEHVNCVVAAPTDVHDVTIHRGRLLDAVNDQPPQFICPGNEAVHEVLGVRAEQDAINALVSLAGLAIDDNADATVAPTRFSRRGLEKCLPFAVGAKLQCAFDARDFFAIRVQDGLFQPCIAVRR